MPPFAASTLIDENNSITNFPLLSPYLFNQHFVPILQTFVTVTVYPGPMPACLTIIECLWCQ